MIPKNPEPNPELRVLVIGARGRLGAAFAKAWSPRYRVQPVTREQLDVSDSAALEKFLASHAWDVLVNASGATSLEACEDHPDTARQVNAVAPRLMAGAATSRGARMIHFSTDYVFDGTLDRPYLEEDLPNPLSVYGHSKWEGENAVLASSPRHACFRVSWVFGPERPSFVDAMLKRAIASERVEAVDDKTSCPAFTGDLAEWVEPFLQDHPGGLFHACNAGTCSWKEFAGGAVDIATRLGWPIRAREVAGIPLAAMTAFRAARPRHTPMDCAKLARTTGIRPRPWPEALEEYLRSLPPPATA